MPLATLDNMRLVTNSGISNVQSDILLTSDTATALYDALEAKYGTEDGDGSFVDEGGGIYVFIIPLRKLFLTISDGANTEVVLFNNIEPATNTISVIRAEPPGAFAFAGGAFVDARLPAIALDYMVSSTLIAAAARAQLLPRRKITSGTIDYVGPDDIGSKILVVINTAFELVLPNLMSYNLSYDEYQLLIGNYGCELEVGLLGTGSITFTNDPDSSLHTPNGESKLEGDGASARLVWYPVTPGSVGAWVVVPSLPLVAA